MESAPGPITEVVADIAHREGGRMRLGLDAVKIQQLNEAGDQHGPGSTEKGAAAYFEGTKVYLGAVDQRVTQLEDQWKHIGADAQHFVDGLDGLRHLSPKDVDRLVGDQAIIKIIEAADYQTKVGSQNYTKEQLADLTHQAQTAWNSLTTRSKSQVCRHIRHITSGDILGTAITFAEDWTLQKTVEAGEKQDLSVVMGDVAGRLRGITGGLGVENESQTMQDIVAKQKTRLATQTKAVLDRLDKGVSDLTLGMGVLSTNVEVQQKVQEALTRLQAARESFTSNQALVGGNKPGEIPITNIRFLQGMANDADSIVKTTEEAVHETGLKGKVAGGAGEVAEARAVVGTGIVGKTVVEVATAMQIRNELGWVEADLRKRIGTSLTIDVNGLIKNIPLVGGLRQLREILRARATEQLDAVHKIMTGEHSKTIAQDIQSFCNHKEPIDARMVALRRLKDVGLDMMILGDFKRDAQTMALAQKPQSGQTEAMSQAWDQLHEACRILHEKLGAITSPELVSVDGEINQGMVDFAVDSLQHHLNALGFHAQAQKLHTPSGWNQFVMEGAKGRFGRWLREVATPLWNSRSPAKLSGVEYDADGKASVAGISGEVAKGLTALKSLTNPSESPLEAALAGIENTRGINPLIAVLATKTGNSDAGERARSFFSKKYHALKGMGAELDALKILNLTHAESVIGWEMVAAAGIAASPAISAAVGYIGKEGAALFKQLKDLGMAKYNELTQTLEALQRTAVESAKVNGPRETVNTAVESAMRDAGARDIANRIRSTQVGQFLSGTATLASSGAQWLAGGVRDLGAGAMEASRHMLAASGNRLVAAAEIAGVGATLAGASAGLNRAVEWAKRKVPGRKSRR
ncbi:hypothetical protein MUP32_06565 [Candidatus Microgenomates bacterium]|nr:hypothetical protein [Candidatus Microgenomates bacterium]